MSAVGTLHSNANSSVPSSSNGAQAATQAADQTGVKSKEYYVKIPKNRKRFHALKFHTSNVDLVSWPKAEMTRDTTNLPTYQRPEWEVMPKTGQGSEYNRDNKELARRRKFGYMPKKTSI
jgi:hypothetical protein